MGEVVELPVDTCLPLPSDRLLQAAIDGEVRDVVIVGYAMDGSLWFSSADPDVGHVLWLLELAKRDLLNRYGDQPAPPLSDNPA